MTRKPTREELIAAGWISPPPPPPNVDDLLGSLFKSGSHCWTMFGADADEVLHKLHRSGGHPLLRHKVTKRWGDMWRLADADNPRFYKGET